MFTDPAPVGQRQDEVLVEPTGRAEVDVLDTCIVSEPGAPEPVGELSGVLSVTLFRRGFLGLFLIERDSICHIDPSSSESRAGAVRLEGQGGATVIAMITGVVVKMDWPAHPTPGSAGGG